MAQVSFVQTDKGLCRRHNEDAYVANDRLGLYIVADGMGGHHAGEVASRMAVERLSAELARREAAIREAVAADTPEGRRRVLSWLKECVQRASSAIYEAAQNNDAQRGMGTTLTALLVRDSSAFLAHVGDSRAYLWREGELHLLTNDHTLIAEQIRRGLVKPEDARELGAFGHIITRGVGVLAQVEVDTLHLELATGDRFLLCSDGLYDVMDSWEVRDMVAEPSLAGVPARFVERANQRGGKDNVTALVVEVRDLPEDAGKVAVRRKLETLRQIPLFQKLSYAELVKTLNVAELRQAEIDEWLIRQGEEGDRLYILVQGEVEVLRDGVAISTLPRGGHFGEMALVSRQPRSASVRATRTCSLLTIARQDFVELLQSEPALAVKILLAFVEVLSSRLSDTSQAVLDWRRSLIQSNAPS